jgi:hypothetical protein
VPHSTALPYCSLFGIPCSLLTTSGGKEVRHFGHVSGHLIVPP